MAIAVLTPSIAPYRVPLYERLARDHAAEIVVYGGGGRYVPSWFAADEERLLFSSRFPARRLTGGWRSGLGLAARYDAIVAPYGGGPVLAAYLGCRRRRTPFVLWASVWSQPRSPGHALALPLTRHMYRHADAVVAYGPHVRRYLAGIRGREDDVFVAPQAVEAELFQRFVEAAEIDEFRARHGLPPGPLVLYVGRLVPEKGIEVLLEAWTALAADATLVLIGDGPLAGRGARMRRVREIGPRARADLPVAYAAAEIVVVPSIPTPRFLEPWGLVCNEAMHQARPVIATTAVGAAAGGLVRDGDTGLVVAPGSPAALAEAIGRLLGDPDGRARLGARARQAVGAYTYDAMAAAFDRALERALRPSGSGPARGSRRSTAWPTRRRT